MEVVPLKMCILSFLDPERKNIDSMPKYMCTKHANVEYMNASRNAHTVFPRVSKITVAFIIFIFLLISSHQEPTLAT